jgi:phosphoglucomutase
MAFFCVLTLTAQSNQQPNALLTGIISDALSGDPLIGATVILRSDPTVGSVANLDGVYRILLPEGSHELICRFSGMMNDTLRINVESGQRYSHNFALKSND